MKITYLPGVSPASIKQIQFYAGTEKIENIRIESAQRKDGKLTVKMEIFDCEINREIEREIHSEVQGQSGPEPGGADQGKTDPSNPLTEGAPDIRRNLQTKRSRYRNKGKDKT